MPQPCPSPEQGCKYFGTPECFENTHHLYWPSPDYTDKVERFFRELPQNKERMQRCDHDELHATQDPPEKPTRDFMVGFILASDVHIPSSVRKDIRRGTQGSMDVR